MNTGQFEGRISKLCTGMKESGLDVLLLTRPSNMFYLTGDGRLCAYTMITQAGDVALGIPVTDLEDVKQLAYHQRLVSFDDEVGMIHSIAHNFDHFGIQSGSVGLEFSFLTQSMLAMLTHPHAKPDKVEPRDCTHLLSTLRMVKEPGEIERIRASAQVADAGMMAAVQAVKENATESMLAATAEYAMREAGAEGFWRSYVSSGPRTNLAHGLPTRRKLQLGDLVMIDLHPILDGYSADICRTVCLGKPGEAQKTAYELYLHAQQSTIAMLKAGVTMQELEGNMHGVLREAGHAEHIFGPPIHGVGIDFEEAPLPPGHAFFHGEKAPPPLPANTVLAVGNCGLYTGAWGVRVEDTNWIFAGGYETLTNYPRFLRA